jgi:LAS superfamily LD-carboxypeptidase LdcB
MSTKTHEIDVAQAQLAAARGRESARLARLAQARAARLRLSLASGPAGCRRGSTSGMANGNLDPAVLCPLQQAPGHRLWTDAALAFDRLSRFHLKAQGTPLCITDSYRTYSEQVDVYQRKPQLAAVPGTSNHGWGRAIDMCGGVQTAGTAAYRWMKQFGPQFGWHHPAWAEPNGSKPEAWHWEYGG